MATPIYDDLAARVPLLMHFDGDFTDSSQAGQIMTVGGGAALSGAQPPFGSAMADLRTNGAYVRSPNSPSLALSMDEYSLEFWLYPVTAANGLCVLATTSVSGVGGRHMWVGFTPAGRLRWNTSSGEFYTDGPVLAPGAWYQVLLCERLISPVGAYGRQAEIWVNGVLRASKLGIVGAGLAGSEQATTWFLGRVPEAFDGSPNTPCYLDEVRLTLSAARASDAQTRPFSNQPPPTYWPGAGSTWPGGVAAI